MSFFALFLLIIGITLLTAAMKDTSPFIVAKAFLENKSIEEYER